MKRRFASAVSVLPIDAHLRVPGGVCDLGTFRLWSRSRRFPERGRIDYLQGVIDADMSPEDLLTHGTAKAAIAGCLHTLIVTAGRGLVLIDRARVVAPAARLSVEPDVVVVLRESLVAKRVRMVPGASRRPGRYIELEGAPDLVVEVLSDASESKDRKRLPALYAQAGVRELWLVDARGAETSLEIWTLEVSGYTRVPADTPAAIAWTLSPALGHRFRLRRHEVPELFYFYHELEHIP